MNNELDENGYKKSKLSLEDLENQKYSYQNLGNAERFAEYNKSDRGRKTSSKNGKARVADGTFSGKGSKSQNALDNSGWYESEKLRNIFEENRCKDPMKGVQALHEKGYYGSEKHMESVMKASKAGHAALKAKDGYKPFNKAGHAASHEKTQCIHCSEEGDTCNIQRWHNDNCKEKPEIMNQILNLLPEIFTEKQWKNAFKTIGHKANARHILKKGKYAKKIYEGTYGSPKDVNLFKKISK